MGRAYDATRIDSQSPPPETHDELCARAASYAATVDLAVDLDRVSWEVTTRAKRRAGLCLYTAETGAVTIRLTWGAYESFGWERFRDVIRHELIHAWEFQQFGESTHGERFERKARALDVEVHCPQFSPARLRLVCEADDCEWSVRRYRASLPVREPDDRRCGECGSRYAVVHRATGHRWRTERGYREARSAIGDDW